MAYSQISDVRSQIGDTDASAYAFTEAEVTAAIEETSTEIPCFNPDCSRRIKTTPSQKRDFLISFKLKYDKVVLPTCSKECREKLLALLS